MRINADLPPRLLHKILFFEILIVKGFHEGFADTKFAASVGFLVTNCSATAIFATSALVYCHCLVLENLKGCLNQNVKIR